jgi:Carbohydrate-binding family 9
MESLPEYRVVRAKSDFPVPGEPSLWSTIPALNISHYLWLDNGYRPHVEVRLCHSQQSLYVHFDVFEAKIRVRYTRFQDPVYKDSCVEFFVDLFPERKAGYINFETNALGAMLVAIGPDRNRRIPIPKADLKGLEIVSSIKRPISGYHGAEFWTLAYKIPLRLFEQYYGSRIKSGHIARANFYKCGDETETPHFGAWSPIQSPQPDFHRPEFFGRLIFQ